MIFLLGWSLGPVLLLSVSAGKEVRYLISGIPAWALLLAESFEAARARGRFRAYRDLLARLAIGISWAGPAIVIAASFSLHGAPRIAGLVAGGILLLARVVARLGGRRSFAIPAAAALLALLGAKVFWAEAYFGEARARQPVMETGRRISAEVPPDRELAVQLYDSVVHLAVDRPLRLVPDLAANDFPSSVIALVASDAVVGPGWTEMDHFQLGSRRYRLLHR